MRTVTLLLLIGGIGLTGCHPAQTRGDRELSDALGRLERSPAGKSRLYEINEAARLSINLGKLSVAETLVREQMGMAKALQNRHERMPALHRAFANAGRIALRERRLSDAKADLLAAGQALSQGHPRWFSGPDMALAKELLEMGEYPVVLNYLALCQRYSWSISTLYWRVSLWFGFLPSFSTLT